MKSAQRSWALARVAALLLVVTLLSPVSPVMLVAVPLAIVVLAFRPGRVTSYLLAAGLAWLAFAPTDGVDALWLGERAWALITGGAFVVLTLLWPGQRLALRSIVAVGGGFAAFGLFGLLQPGGLARLDWWMASELRWTSRVVASWLAGSAPDSLLGTLAVAVDDMVEIQIALYPSLLALATLAALGVAWAVTIRLSDAEGQVGPLREFEFSDHLIWVFIGGLLLLLLPVGTLAARIGENALAFMGGLYVLRGVAVLLWLVPAAMVSSWSAVLWAVLVLFFYPIVLGLALVLGVSDTWLHIRRRISGSAGSQGST